MRNQSAEHGQFRTLYFKGALAFAFAINDDLVGHISLVVISLSSTGEAFGINTRSDLVSRLIGGKDSA